MAQRPLPLDSYTDWTIALLAAGNDNDAELLLTQLGRTQPDEEAEQQFALPLQLELLHVALRVEQGHQQDALDGFARIEDLLIEPNMPEAARAESAMTLAWVGALFELASEEQVEDWLAEAKDAPEVQVYEARARGWLALHEGDSETARELFQPHTEHDLLAKLGLALLEQQRPARMQALRSVNHHDPASLAGILAARRVRAAGESPEPTADGSQLKTAMAQHPRQLWEPNWHQVPWVTVGLQIRPRQARYMEPIIAEVQIRNRSRMPLPLDDQRGIPTEVMLTLASRQNDQWLPRPAPLSRDVGRKLVIEPGQRLDVPVRLTRTQFANLIDQHLESTLHYELGAILGPTIDPSSRWSSDVLGGFATSRHQLIRAESLDEQQIDTLLDYAADDAEPVRRKLAIARLLSTITRLPADLDVKAMQQRIADSIHEQFDAMDATQRAWLIGRLPRNKQAPALFEPILERAAADESPLVRLMHLARHVRDPESQPLQEALTSDHPPLRRYARALRDSLQDRAEKNDLELPKTTK